MNKENKVYFCKNCKAVFQHRQSQFKHENNCGKDNIIFACDGCDYKTVRKDTLLRHKRNCRGWKKDITCNICSKKFKCKADLKRHEKIHTREIYQCEFCEENCKHKDFYMKHKKSCFPDAPLCQAAKSVVCDSS